MKLLDALTERVRRDFEWSVNEVRSEFDNGYPILKTITSPNVPKTIEMVEALGILEQWPRLLLLTRTAGAFRNEILGNLATEEEEFKARMLRKNIYIESSRSVSYYAFTITTDRKPKIAALRKECKKILKDLTGVSAATHGPNVSSSYQIADWTCQLTLQNRGGDSVLAASANITRSDSASPFVPFNLRMGGMFGYAENLGCGNTDWLMNDATDPMEIAASARQICERTLDAFAFSVAGLNIDD